MTKLMKYCLEQAHPNSALLKQLFPISYRTPDYYTGRIYALLISDIKL